MKYNKTMSAYLTPGEASERLRGFSIFWVPLQRHLKAPSHRLDGFCPFLSERYGVAQQLAFPRTYTLDGDTAGEVPESIKDWVALEAYKLSQPDAQPVTSEPIPTIGTIQYSRPARSQAERYQDGILERYFRRIGSLT